MRSSFIIAAVALVALLALTATPAPAQADHCFATCCSIGWQYYGYNNVTKRASALSPSDSSCNCASDVASSCKPSTSEIVQRKAKESQPQPNDTCFAACCSNATPPQFDASPKPQFPVAFYSYGDFEIVQNPMGACVCYMELNFACVKPTVESVARQ